MSNEKEELESSLRNLRDRISEAEKLLQEGDAEKANEILKMLGSSTVLQEAHTQPASVPEGSRVIEGVFDGQHMIGADGKQYLVPPNYASKSKLVEGDMMKLSITPQGAFIYKQIGPIGRKRLMGTLTIDEASLWHATDGVHSWRLLTAAVTYFKGKAGDEVIIFIPSDAPSKWAAVENIIPK